MKTNPLSSLLFTRDQLTVVLLMSAGLFCVFAGKYFLAGRTTGIVSTRPMAYIYALRGDTDRQGVYCFKKAQTLGTLLRAAGESLPAAMDPGLAVDGGTLLFFRNGTMRVQRMDAFERLALHIPLSLNRVTAEELCVIPGIGSATAQAIVSHRDRFGLFQQLSELAAVPGIGKKKLRAMTAYLTVSD